MIYNKKGETIVSIIITIVIIGLIMISISKIIEYDNNLNYEYDKINHISILEKNANILAKKINILNFEEWDLFFIYQTWSEIKAYSWIQNMDYKYINYLWEYINTWSYNWAIYTRQCLVEKKSIEWQMIKCSVKELIKK